MNKQKQTLTLLLVILTIIGAILLWPIDPDRMEYAEWQRDNPNYSAIPFERWKKLREKDAVPMDIKFDPFKYHD